MDCYDKNKYHKVKPGYAYVPEQKLNKVYGFKEALKCGTIFPELDISMKEYDRGIR